MMDPCCPVVVMIQGGFSYVHFVYKGINTYINILQQKHWQICKRYLLQIHTKNQ